MSSSDDSTGLPDRPSFLGGRAEKDRHYTGQDPLADDHNYALHMDPGLNDQSEYSQVGGKRNSNQQYPSSGQHPGQGYGGQHPLDGQGGYPPVDGQNGYAQPQYGGAYAQPGYNGSAGYQQPGYGQPAPGSGNYAPYGGGYDSGQGYPGQQGYQNPPADGAYAGYQSAYDQSGYAYPAGSGETYDNYGNHQQGMDDTSFLDSEYPDETYQEQRPRRSKLPMMLGSVLALAVVGGGLGYAWSNGMFTLGEGTRSADSSPLLIRRDASSIRERPADEGGKDVQHKNKKIYARLEGQSDSGGSQERLQSREEKTMETGSTRSEGVPGFSVGNVGGSPEQRPETDNNGVQTVKVIPVRPDGSYGSSEGSGGVPGFSISGGQESVSSDRGGDPGIVRQTLSGSGQSEEKSESASEENKTSVIGQAIQPIRREPAREEEPVRESRPEPVQQQEAQPQKVAAISSLGRDPSGGAQESAGTGDYVIQVAARREQTDALVAFADMQQKYPDILQSYRPLIQRADLSSQGKGIWYRLRIGPMTSKDTANTVCQQLKDKGFKSCFVRRQ